jgi:MoaA/NifB/PqqE/SkfB family radical SAM enzyme
VIRGPILLVQPPLSLSRDFIDYPYHCDLGVVQAAAVLRRDGFETRVIDAFAMPNAGLFPLGRARVLLGAASPAVVAACDQASGSGGPDAFIVSYTPFHRPPQRDALLGELLTQLRAHFPSTPVVLADLYQSGQHYVEAAGADILSAYPVADVLVKYEAEAVLSPLLTRLAGIRPSSPEIVHGTEIPDLDSLPRPAWDLVDLPARDACLARVVRDLGRASWAFPIDGRTLPAITSRGCPFRCAHCSSNPGRPSLAAPKTQRRHSAAYLAQLARELVEVHGATRIDVLDEMVNVAPGHLDAVLDAARSQDVAFDFPNGMRADYVEQRHIDAMAGRVATLSVSAESGVQRVVDEVVGKQLELTAIERAADMAARAGIPTLVHFIIGNPGETKRDINATLEYALRLHERHNVWPSIQYATPLPGTALAQRVAAAGSLPVVDDFGPLFQQRPVTSGEDFTPEDLTWFKWTFDQRMAAGRGPRKIIMNVTYKCNNRCTFCAVGTRTQLDGSLDRQKELLAHYFNHGVRLADFDGGEPTLYPDLIPLIRYARQLGYEKVNVTTNGRLAVYEDFARALTRSGITTLLFSVHGPDARTHGIQVGVPEAFEQTVAGIRNCVRVAPKQVELGMNITLTKGNLPRLNDVVQLAWDLGLRWFNIQFLTPFGRATQRVKPDTAEAARLASDVISRWEDRIKFQVINLPFCFMPG